MKSSLKNTAAYLVVLALVLSMLPVYAGAASDENLLGSINYSFEDETIEYTSNKLGFHKNDSSCTVTKVSGTAELPAQDGESYAEITGRSGTGGGIRVIFAPSPKLETYYMASVWVRLGEASEETVTGSISMSPPGSNTVQATNLDTPVLELSADRWTKLYRIFRSTPKAGATEPYTNMGLHLAFATNDAGAGVDLHVDNFSVTEYTPQALDVVETTPQNGETGVLADTTQLKVTFNNKLKGFSKDNVTISPSGEITNATCENYTWTFDVSGLEKEKEYTVEISDAQDIFGNILPAYSFTFETEGDVYVPDANNLLGSINYSFESEAIEYVTNKFGFHKNDSACTVTRTRATETLPAQDGKHYAEVTGRTGTNGGIRVIYAPAPDMTKTYIASVWVRLGEESDEAVTASVSMSAPTGSDVQMKNLDTPTKELSSDSWTKLYRIFTVHPKSDATEPYNNRGFHFGFSTNDAGVGADLHVDNFSVAEYTPDALVVTETTPEDGATDVEKGAAVSISFNHKLSSVDKNQISITNGGAVDYITTVDNTTTVKFKRIRNNCTYTVTLSDITDIYGEKLDSYSFTFTTGARVPAENLIINPGFEENGTENWTFSNNLGHWEAVTEEAHSGSYSIRSCENGEGVSCQLFQRVPVEPNTQYVYSFYAKIGGTSSFALREASKKGSPVIEGTVITISPSTDWERYSVVFNSGENTVIQLWHRHNSSEPNYYDDFSFVKHEGGMEIEFSSVADGDTDVPVNIGTIALDMSYKIDPDEIQNIAQKFTIDNGAEISSVEVSDDRNTINITLNGNLKNDTTYKLSYKAISDEYGVECPKGSITFTTKPDFIVKEAPSISGTTASAVVENCTSETVENVPVLMAAVYNADKTLAYVKATAFEGSIAPFAEHTLTIDGLSVSTEQSCRLYLVTSAENMTLISDSVGADLGFDKENGNKISVNPQEEVIEIAGIANPHEEVLIVIIETDNNISAYDSYAENKVKAKELLTEANLSGNVYTAVSVTADENGSYSIVLPMPVSDSEKVYGVLRGANSLNGNAEAVYIPSAAVYADAKTKLASVTDSTVEAFMDTYAKAFGISLSSPSYTARKEKILRALYSLRPSGGYTDYTSFNGSKTFKKDFAEVLGYYERQDEALAKINSATNQSLTEILGEYSDVLGDYEASQKLDFNSKYAAYGAVNINRQLVGFTYGSMDEFINKFNSTVYASNQNSSLVTPGGGGGGGSSKGSSGAFGGGLGLVPENTEANKKQTFSDLGEAKWAEESINKLAEMGIINGVGNGEFRPNANVTREQFLKMLMLSLSVEIDTNAHGNIFSDVDSNEWYAPYVMAAYKLGIVNGVSETAFGIGNSISRQDMAVMISRAAELCKVELGSVRSVSFSDTEAVSGYARDAVNKLAQAGIINGMTETTFAPAEITTRAQSAVVLDRIITLKGEN